MGLEESRKVKWAAMEKDENSEEESFESSSITDSEELASSSLSSSELTDDASSSSSSNSCGPLYELAHELMAQLPIKRGLSKYYHGKSQTFASLENVRSVEDLAKKESSYSKRMKSCKSYGANLNRHKFSPKAIIAKKSSPKGSFSPSLTNKATTMVVN